MLAEPSPPLRHSAPNSLRVGAENLTMMTDLLMVWCVMCEADERTKPCVPMESFPLTIDLPHSELPVRDDHEVLGNKSMAPSSFAVSEGPEGGRGHSRHDAGQTGPAPKPRLYPP